MFQDLPLKKGDIIVISNKTKVSSVEKKTLIEVEKRLKNNILK